MYKIVIKKKIMKSIDKMPGKVRKKMFFLIEDLAKNGPLQKDWPNYSILSDNLFHCHLTHKWVACWKHEKNSIIIEVYYAGSRENAPY